MQTAVMDEILRQKDAGLKETVRASLAGEIARAFEKLDGRVAEVNPDDLSNAAAAHWLKLPAHERENTGLMAPSHALRREINGHIRERLARDGVIRGPAMQGERLGSYGYANAEKMLAANYSPGDVVAFHRDYRSLGVAKGDERRVAGVDGAKGIVMLEGKEGETVAWRPRQVGAKRGGVEVYRKESWSFAPATASAGPATMPDSGSSTATRPRSRWSGVAEVAFRLDDGRTLELGRDDPQPRHLDHAWASTVRTFQGRTVDYVIAVMEATHPHLTTQKSFYGEISRARHGAELVTDDAKALHEALESATGERVSALEGIGASGEKAGSEAKGRGRAPEAGPEAAGKAMETPDRSRDAGPEMAPEPKQKSMEMDFGRLGIARGREFVIVPSKNGRCAGRG